MERRQKDWNAKVGQVPPWQQLEDKSVEELTSLCFLLMLSEL